ncbi:diguanylate cyclase [Azospirillum sp. sgz301742]
MILDSRTLVVVAILLAAMFGAAHFLTWRINRSAMALRYCATADLIAALGFLLVALRGPDPPVWTLVATNAALAAFHVYLWRTVRFFTGQPIPLRPLAALVAAYLLGALYFSAVVPSVSARIALVSCYAAVMGTLCATDLLRNARGFPSTPVSVVGFILLGHAGFNVLRAGLSLADAQLPDLLAPSVVQTLAFMENLLVFVAIGIGLVIMTTERLQADLRRTATYDMLTGILNRRAFLDLAEREMARSRRSGVPHSLLVMDVDYFKQVNDTYGHQAGDAVLKAVTATIAGSLRQVDLFGRYGGEEFCILLPETRQDAALVVGERICAMLAGLVVPHDGNLISTTVSIGVAESLPGAASFDTLVAEADAALYRAKSLGRNRAIVHQPEPVGT